MHCGVDEGRSIGGCIERNTDFHFPFISVPKNVSKKNLQISIREIKSTSFTAAARNHNDNKSRYDNRIVVRRCVIYLNKIFSSRRMLTVNKKKKRFHDHRSDKFQLSHICFKQECLPNQSISLHFTPVLVLTCLWLNLRYSSVKVALPHHLPPPHLYRSCQEKKRGKNSGYYFRIKHLHTFVFR